jgi:hypothetical protein
MSDAYETLVRWYLRFNGYLGVESFAVHEPSSLGVSEGAEFDTLGVRFPYSREEAQFRIQNDPRLQDEEAQRKCLIDFVVAEVKSGEKLSLNRIWRSPDPQDIYLHRIMYLVRWLGPFQDEGRIQAVSSELQRQHRTARDGYLFRLIYFACRRTTQAVPETVRQITFRDIAEFVVDVRTPCWVEHGLGVRSAHPQWDPMIKKIWEIGDPNSDKGRDEKIEQILASVDAEQCR